jgi:hypothetical protein
LNLIGQTDAIEAGNTWSLTADVSSFSGTVYIRAEIKKGSDVLVSKVRAETMDLAGREDIELIVPVYTVSADYLGGPTTIGSLSASKTEATEGTLISLTAAPSNTAKYRIRQGTLKALQDSAELVLNPVEGNADQYTFAMPGGNTVVQARFEAITDLAGLTTANNSTAFMLDTPFASDTLSYNVSVFSSIAQRTISGTTAANRIKISPVAAVTDTSAAGVSLSYFTGAAGTTPWSGAAEALTSGDIITIRVSSNVSGDSDNIKNYRLTITRSTASTLPQITSISFSTTNNTGNISANITGTPNHTANTITFSHGNSTYDNTAASKYRWVNDFNLKASFTVNPSSAAVYVNNVQQSSAQTANDFSQTLVYKVVSSDGLSREYTIIFHSPQFSDLPSIRINTQGNAPIISTGAYVKTNVQVIDPANPAHNFNRTEYQDEIRGRGNSTWQTPTDGYNRKNPFRIKFGSKVSMFGYTSAKSWVLLANDLEPTLLMNTAALELGNRLRVDYTNHTTPVELYLNEIYMGSYVLTEQVQVNPGRVDIDEDNGFLVNLDFKNFAKTDEVGFRTNRYRFPVVIESPEFEDADGNPMYPGSHANFAFIRDDLNALTDAVYNNTPPGAAYRDLIDIDNWARFILVNEVVRNVEFQNPLSTYLYKDSAGGSKIKMGPPWDFDYGFNKESPGPYFSTANNGASRMFMNYQFRNGTDDPSTNTFNVFITKLFSDPVFKSTYKSVWNEHYADISDMTSFMDSASAEIAKSFEENKRRWSKSDVLAANISSMKTWWNARVSYLNSQISSF